MEKPNFRERRVIVAKAACIMRERADELARLITLETGKLFAAPNLMEGNVVMVKHSNC